MAARIPFPPLLFFLFVFSYSFIPQSASQFTPQNIQVFYPFALPPPPPSLPPPLPPQLPPVTTAPVAAPAKSSNKTVAKAVAATAASTLVLSGLFFLILVKYKNRRRKEPPPLRGGSSDHTHHENTHEPVLQMKDQFTRFEGIKGVIVDEEGLDVLYWKNLDDGFQIKTEFLRIEGKEEQTKMMTVDRGGKKSKKFESKIQEIPLLRGKSSGSHVWPVENEIKIIRNNSVSVSVSPPVANQEILTENQLSSRSPPPTPPPPPLFPVKTGGLSSSRPAAPPLPPPAPPLFPAKTGGLTSSRPAALVVQSPVKLKPLHWDKVNPNVGHSMVWHKLDKGSFRFNGDLMEALFGTVAANKKSTQENPNSPTPKPEPKTGPPSQIFLLDTRKSQNIAIILRSLTISRREIIDCLLEGTGLDIETLEKLTRIAPTKPEETLILEYDRDVTRLSDAESFLYHILRAVPSAFTRFNAMFFKLNYVSEVTHLKKSLETLENACKELRTRALFVKLLEAILKAGNRMNAGTSRGNAQAFNLNSLLKLSDVKSSDGKTTLLHFVVEEVVRLEGKRCMVNRNHSLRSSTFGLNSDSSRDRDYIMLGLPIVGGVSSEFSNVKKAAGINYNALTELCSGLSDHLGEITKTLEECAGDGAGRGFVREMERFVERAEREIEILRKDEERVMGIVKETNEYYQAGASKDKGKKQFKLFVIVKTFLEMVDKACVDIAVKLQKRRTGGGAVVVPPMVKSPERPSVKFPVLPASFISSSSSDSDEDM